MKLTSLAGLLQQLCSMTDPSGGTTTFGYSSAWLGPNQVTSVTDRRNVHTTFTYYTGYPTIANDFSLSYQAGQSYENQAGQPHGFWADSYLIAVSASIISFAAFTVRLTHPIPKIGSSRIASVQCSS